MKQIVTKKVKLELVGLDGNVFYLMGAFSQAAKRQGTPNKEREAVLRECLNGDYNHLLCTLMENTTTDGREEDEE